MKGMNGMKQAQGVAEDEIDHRERVRFARTRWFRVRHPERGLARFEIPIAKFAPEKAIERLGGLAEIVFLERRRDRADRGVEAQQDPFVVTS